MFECMYCSTTTINYPMYVVRKASGPPNTPNRWKDIGHCCEKCHDSGEPIRIEENND